MSFTCPRCGMISHHPMDEQEGYCANCSDWTGDKIPSVETLHWQPPKPLTPPPKS